MPILAQESCLFPETLLTGLPSEMPGCQWWVLYTKARQEKAIARDLSAYEVPFYLPIVRKTAMCRDRKVTSHVPLFPGYVFLFGSEDQRVQALTTNRISRVLPVYDPERLERDLQQIWQLIATKVPLTVEARLEPGERVRVRYGPFEGLEGVVLRRQGETRLLVTVDFLQRGASVEIDDFMLEPID